MRSKWPTILFSTVLAAGLILAVLASGGRPVHAAPADYAVNGGAESGTSSPASWTSWTDGSASLTWDSAIRHAGAKSLKIAQSSTANSTWFQDTTALTPGRSYTLTGWMKTSAVTNGINGNAQVVVEFYNAASQLLSSVRTASFYGTVDWTRVSLKFAVPSGTQTVRIGGYLWSTVGTVWFDDFSLIDQLSVLNGDMEAGGGSAPGNFSSWSNVGATFSWDTGEYHAGYRSAKISQSSRGSSTWYQTLNGWEIGKTYTVSGWLKTSGVAANSDLNASIAVNMTNSAGTLISQAAAAKLSGTVDWTRVSFTFTVPANTDAVTLQLVLWDTAGTVWFDDIKGAEQVAYMKNGTMESGAGATPEHYTAWTGSPGVPTFTWDSTVFHNPFESPAAGTRSLKITQAGAAYSAWWQFLTDWKPGKTYRVGGWVKTSGVQSGSGGEGALLSVDISDPTDAWLSSDNSEELYGTHDWVYRSVKFTVPAQAYNVKLVLKLFNKSGTVWFDSLTVMELPDEEIAEPAVVGKWWDYWPRFTANSGGNLDSIVNLEANVTTVSIGAADEGRGAFLRETEFVRSAPFLDAMEAEGIRSGAWLEHAGEARAILGAVNHLGGGVYETDPLTGAPRLIAHNWTWDTKGPDVNANADTPVWMGLHSWADQEAWQGSYARPNTFAAPTTPSGSPVSGYSGGIVDPLHANFYDQLTSKNINGVHTLPCLADRSTTSTTWKIYSSPYTDCGGTTHYLGDIFFGRDIAADWWTQYNIDAAKYFIERGVDSFWVDNYSGYEFIGAIPVHHMFGNWTEALFKEYLADHPGIVPNPSAFDLQTYLTGVFAAWYPGLNPLDLDNSSTLAAWKDSAWLNDGVWKAFMSFKAGVANEKAQALYDGIKGAATTAGKNPDDILVGGNDIPRLTFGALDGDEVDMVNTEYNPYYSVISGFYADGLPPYGHAGPTYSLAVNTAQSKRASIWYYLADDFAKYRMRDNLGEILGYEGLMKNTLINTGNESPSTEGTDAASKKVNRYIKKMTDTFGQRESVGKIGLVYSTQSELSLLTPGGFLNQGQGYNISEFDGWGTALEDLNFPYRAIPDYKLTSAELADFDVLILPHVRVIAADVVDNVLKPFANGGGKILVSGADSGSLKPRSDLFAANASALLYGLTGSGHAQFVSGTPGTDFYQVHTTPGTPRTNALNALKSILDGLVSGNDLVKELTLTSFNDFVLTSLNHDFANNVFFVDLLNENYDLPRDILTPEDGGTLRIHLPSALHGDTVSVKFYDADRNGAAQDIMYTRIDAATIEAVIPGFRVYGSLVIKETPNLATNPGFEADGGPASAPVGWSSSGADTDADYTQAGGHTGTYALAHWKASNYTVYTYQTRTGLANGLYTLKAWVKSDYGNLGTAYMEAKDFGDSAIRYNIPTTSTWTQISIPNIQVSNGQCTFGFYSNTPASQWYLVDDVELYKQ